jgi:hypothetical protein
MESKLKALRVQIEQEVVGYNIKVFEHFGVYIVIAIAI